MAAMRYTASKVEIISGGTGILDLNFGNSKLTIQQTILMRLKIFAWVIPCAGMLFDWLENLFIGLLLIKYPDETVSLLYMTANMATILKFIFVYASLFCVVILFLLNILKKLRIRNSLSPLKPS